MPATSNNSFNFTFNFIFDAFRRNPTENRAISGFSGQKSGTRIILSILQSFFIFLKVNT